MTLFSVELVLLLHAVELVLDDLAPPLVEPPLPSPQASRAKGAMAAGKLVDDSIVLGMIRERLAEADVANGFILDGFPRNLAQARALLARTDAALAKGNTAVDSMQLDKADVALARARPRVKFTNNSEQNI